VRCGARPIARRPCPCRRRGRSPRRPRRARRAPRRAGSRQVEVVREHHAAEVAMRTYPPPCSSPPPGTERSTTPSSTANTCSPHSWPPSDRRRTPVRRQAAGRGFASVRTGDRRRPAAGAPSGQGYVHAARIERERPVRRRWAATRTVVSSRRLRRRLPTFSAHDSAIDRGCGARWR
jgi:hypothetical protein